MTCSYNKSSIARTANYLVGTGMERSDAFRAAWQMARRGGTCKVSGVTHNGRQRLLKRLAGYAPDQITIALKRDKANIFDPNAIAVIASVRGAGSAIVGFIPALTAIKLARLMDRGIHFHAAFDAVVGGCRGLSYGLRLRVAI